MKRLKISLVALAAVVLGFAGSAFTNQPKHHDRTDTWFIYDGSGDPKLPESYFFDDGSTPTCPSSDDILCAIKVMDNDGQPDATALLSLYENNNDLTLPVANLIKFRSR
jgi:hypothetical protein